MAIIRDVVLLAHLLGMALLVGGLLVQARDPEPLITWPVTWGTVLSLASGVVLAAAEFGPTNWPRAGVKFVVLVIVAVLVFFNRRWASIPRGLWALLTGLVTADLAIAVLWH